MDDADIIRFVSALPGVVTLVSSEAAGSPEVSWGDTFFYYLTTDQPLPFATLVIQDYPGFDEASHLGRPGVSRLNIAVGRSAFERLIGYPPAEHASHAARHDYSALDVLLPHPLYASLGWVSILSPGERMSAAARDLLTEARDLAAARHDRREAAARPGPAQSDPAHSDPADRDPVDPGDPA